MSLVCLGHRREEPALHLVVTRQAQGLCKERPPAPCRRCPSLHLLPLLRSQISWSTISPCRLGPEGRTEGGRPGEETEQSHSELGGGHACGAHAPTMPHASLDTDFTSQLCLSLLCGLGLSAYPF